MRPIQNNFLFLLDTGIVFKISLSQVKKTCFLSMRSPYVDVHFFAETQKNYNLWQSCVGRILRVCFVGHPVTTDPN